jgi:hypothetical protein
MLSSGSSIWAFLTLAAAVGIATLFVPRTPQPLSCLARAARRVAIATTLHHTLKHLAAGAAELGILRMLRKRQPIPQHGMHTTAEPAAH